MAGLAKGSWVEILQLSKKLTKANSLQYVMIKCLY